MSDDDQDRIDSLNEIFAAGRRVVEELHRENVELRERVADLEAGREGPSSGHVLAERVQQLETQYQELMQEFPAAQMERACGIR